jgi:hypothetical protein
MADKRIPCKNLTAIGTYSGGAKCRFLHNGSEANREGCAAEGGADDAGALTHQMGALRMGRSVGDALDTLADPWRWCMLYNVGSNHQLSTTSYIIYSQ